jgi:eukaryotic-like serine/threonine-protein kinase
MKTEDWQKVNEIVLDALELDVEERQEFIKKCCAGAPEIRDRVESLLAAEAEAEKFFSAAAVTNYASFFDEGDDQEALAGQEIGNYRIIRELASGGMGAVYLAERADGKFEQKVALKLLRREMNTASLRRRFEQERAILASLEHPNIARLLDAGTTDDKIPFLAMEYVEGLSIDDYCHQNSLDLNARLDLFRKVCSAVGFAHRNLVIHRDLKPSNILVTDEGIPKLLDFGISKILSAGLENAAATVTKLGMMTPSYASPEQLKMESVTTASDIYSLGVILYELLSGHRPFETREDDLKEIYKAVIETEPPPPSALVETVPRELKRKLHMKPEWLEAETSERETKSNRTSQTLPNINGLSAGSLRGDLDNIVLKALRKEPERRYSSAENLAEDIHRHQRGLPVTARPNTFSYRAEKFFKRNKASAIVGVLLIAAVVAGIIATLWQAQVAKTERDRARIETEKVKKINAYTQNILNFSNPHWLSSNPKRNRDAKISDALDEALKNIDTDLASEPEIQAEILFTLSQTYVSQGQYDKANTLLRQSIEKFNQVSGIPNLKSMQASVILGDTLYLTGKMDEAEKFYTESINYFRPKIVADKSQAKWLVIALNDLGNVYAGRGKYPESKALIAESVELARSLTDRDRYVLPIVLGNFGTLHLQIGEHETALEYYNQTLRELRAMGNEQRLEGGTLYTNLGRIHFLLEDYKTAEDYFQKAYEILLSAVGEENVYTLQNRLHCAINYYKQEKYDEARSTIDKTLQIQNKIYPNGHFTIAFSQRILGAIYTKTGELGKGETEIRQALDLLSKTYKEPNPEISLIKTTLGENLMAQKRNVEANEVLTSALDGYIKTKGENHPSTKQCRELLSKIPQN